MPEKMDYIIVGLGVLAAVIVSSYVPALVKAASYPKYTTSGYIINENH